MPEKPTHAAKSLFIRRWGEMAASWGISRTMAEVHALLFLSPEPLCTDDLMDQLAVSRGSASMNLRELVNWGLINRVHRRGVRKEYYEGQKDVWQMFETITRERRRREVQPIVETLRRCSTMLTEHRQSLTPEEVAEADVYLKRFSDILRFFEIINSVFNSVTKAGAKELGALVEVLSLAGEAGGFAGLMPGENISPEGPKSKVDGKRRVGAGKGASGSGE